MDHRNGRDCNVPPNVQDGWKCPGCKGRWSVGSTAQEIGWGLRGWEMRTKEGGTQRPPIV
jgi:hypothetical protein